MPQPQLDLRGYSQIYGVNNCVCISVLVKNVITYHIIDCTLHTFDKHIIAVTVGFSVFDFLECIFHCLCYFAYFYSCPLLKFFPNGKSNVSPSQHYLSVLQRSNTLHLILLFIAKLSSSCSSSQI